jgi:threonine dehydratase
MDHDIAHLTLQAITARAAMLAPAVRHTPTIPLDIPSAPDITVFAKLELFQHTGTFKARGALSNAMAIPKARRSFGITAASAGNHAIAAGWAARQCGLSAKVVMQNTANPFRVALARAQGAEVILRDPGAATFAEAERLATEEGRTFLHPFDGVNTLLGSGGVGLELMQEMLDLDAVIVSVGGGGLIGGVAAAVKAINPDCAVYGVEPEGADSMSRSLAAGAPVTLEKVQTIADSLAPPMALPLGHAVCHRFVDDMVIVSDDAICAGMVVLAEVAKLAVEPAAGAVVAGLLGPLRTRLTGKRVGLIICGANIDTQGLETLLARGRAFLARS